MAKRPEKTNPDDHLQDVPEQPGGGLSWWQKIGRGGQDSPFKNEYELLMGGEKSIGTESRLIKKITGRALEDEKLAIGFLDFAKNWIEETRGIRSPKTAAEILEAATKLAKTFENAGIRYFQVLRARIGAQWNERDYGRTLSVKDNLPHSQDSLTLYSDACDVAEQFEKSALAGFQFLKTEIERGKFTPDEEKKRSRMNTDSFRVQALERILQSFKTMALKFDSMRGPLRDQAAALLIKGIAESPYETGLALGTVVEASRGDEERGLRTIFRIHSALKERGLPDEKKELLADAAQELVRPLVDVDHLLELFNTNSGAAIIKRQSILELLDETGILTGRLSMSLHKHFNAVREVHKETARVESEIEGEKKTARRDIKALEKKSRREINAAERRGEEAVKEAEKKAEAEMEAHREKLRERIEGVTAAKNRRVGEHEIAAEEAKDQNKARIEEIREEIRNLLKERRSLLDANVKLDRDSDIVREDQNNRLEKAVTWLKASYGRSGAELEAGWKQDIQKLGRESEKEKKGLQRKEEKEVEERAALSGHNIETLRDRIKEMQEQMKEEAKSLFIKPMANGQDGPIGIHPLDAIGVPHDGKPGLGQG